MVTELQLEGERKEQMLAEALELAGGVREKGMRARLLDELAPIYLDTIIPIMMIIIVDIYGEETAYDFSRAIIDPGKWWP